MNTLILLTLIIGIIGAGIFFYISTTKKEQKTSVESKKKTRDDDDEDENENENNGNDDSKKSKKDKGNEKKTTIKSLKSHIGATKNKFSHAVNQKDHPLFCKEIGGHVTSSCCVTFSSKHNLVASASKDGTIRCLPFSDVGVSSPLEIFTNVGDTPTALAFTQNAKRLVVAIKGTLKFYSLIASESERKLELSKNLDTGMKSISSVHLMDVEQWMVIVACGTNEMNEPCVRAFDRQGTRLVNFIQIPRKGRVDKTRLSLSPKALAVASPDDRLLAIYGVAEAEGVKDGEVGIFEIIREKSTGHATGLRLAIVFSGHTSHVSSFGWNSTGKQFITCCPNGQWRIWDATVRYSEYDLPRLYSSHHTLPNLLPTHVGLMKDGIVVLIAGQNIYFCASGSGEILQQINDATVSAITSIAISADGQYLATVVENVKRIAVWTAP